MDCWSVTATGATKQYNNDTIPFPGFLSQTNQNHSSGNAPELFIPQWSWFHSPPQSQSPDHPTCSSHKCLLVQGQSAALVVNCLKICSRQASSIPFLAVLQKNLQRNMNPHHSTLSSVTSAHYQSRRYTNYNMQHCSLKNGELSDVGFIPAPHAHLVLECSPCSDSHRSWANISDISDLSILSNCCFCPHQDLPDKYSRVPPKPVLTAEAPCNSSRLEARGEVRKLAWLGQGGNREGGTARWSRNAATVSRSVLELLKVTNGCKSHTVVPVFWCWWGC